jgi:hypothetical protein
VATFIPTVLSVLEQCSSVWFDCLLLSCTYSTQYTVPATVLWLPPKINLDDFSARSVMRTDGRTTAGWSNSNERANQEIIILCSADNSDDECLVISTDLHRSGLLLLRGGHLETTAMESEETGQENGGTSKEYGPTRRSSGKQKQKKCERSTALILEELNYTLLL